MLDEGRHREAVVWIVFGAYIAHAGLQRNAPESERPQHRQGFDRLVRSLGLTSSAVVRQRSGAAARLADAVSAYARAVVDDIAERDD